MPADTKIDLSPAAERSVLDYAGKAHSLLLTQFSLRGHLEEIDRYYMREMDMTSDHIRSRMANKRGDARKFQDVTVPIVMPQVEAANGYMMNVFLSDYPIFGAAADPANEDAALQIETLISENSVTAGWNRQMIMFFRDGLKYGMHGLECEWQEKNVATIETDVTYPNSAKPKTTIWKGNALRRMDMYNTFFDPRVHISEIHSEGEFAGYIEMMSRIRLKKYINDLYGITSANTAIRAFESAMGGSAVSGSINPFAYYVPSINPSALLDRNNLQTFDWMSWWWGGVGTKQRPTIQYKNIYEVMKLYARILPSDFGLRVPEENTPQVWKFIIVNGQVVLHASRLSNAHGWIPIFFGQPLEDGLDYQTKSFASNVTDMQDVASAMWNGYIASKRRLVGDRVLYDPLRVREADINSTNPAAKIPVRPSAYGKPVAEAVYQFPFHDEQTQSLVQGSSAVVQFANLIQGQNPAQQGQFVKGNKTRKEFTDTMGLGNNRNQSMAMMTEGQVFVPLKQCLLLNYLQYQPDAVIFNTQKQQDVEIKTVDIRKKAVIFKMSDGMLPSEKMMGTEDFAAALQLFAQAPQLAAGYEVPDMLAYLFKMRKADLSPFRKSQVKVLYEQQMNAWQQAAAMAAEKGTAFSAPQPQIPEELKNPQPPQDPKSLALESTIG